VTGRFGRVCDFKSSTSRWDALSLGTGNVTHVPGADFDGDGRTDLAKHFIDTEMLSFRSSSPGLWQAVNPGSDTYTLVTGFNKASSRTTGYPAVHLFFCRGLTGFQIKWNQPDPFDIITSATISA
jgi:hypothetical protein